MLRPHRRRFLADAAALSAAALAAPAVRPAVARSAPNERIAMALVGCGGRGVFHLKNAMAFGDVDCVAVCDVDATRAGAAAKLVREARGTAPRVEADVRRLLEDGAIDAMVIATPHHAHAPIALRALEAGKHVYLEKPAAHAFREGRLLVEAARRAGKVVQHGTQMRSSAITAAAGKVLRGGVLGKILIARAWGVEPRGRFPDPVADSDPPAGLDWDAWLGAAPRVPYNKNKHQNWNNYRAYGNGEIGGDGIHDIDLARWGLGAGSHPVQVFAQGSRVHVAGESDYPDNMLATFVYPDGRSLVYENRNFAPYPLHGWDNGNVFEGTEGYMVFSRRGFFQAYLGAKEEKGPGGTGGASDAEHLRNFLDCVRTGSTPNADATTAHLSCALVHLGEIAHRTGRALRFDPAAEAFPGDDEANAMLTKTYRAPWSVPPA
jgi:predicted dehydrogenase